MCVYMRVVTHVHTQNVCVCILTNTRRHPHTPTRGTHPGEGQDGEGKRGGGGQDGGHGPQDLEDASDEHPQRAGQLLVHLVLFVCRFWKRVMT